jgi:hypothetical protein
MNKPLANDDEKKQHIANEHFARRASNGQDEHESYDDYEIHNTRK